MYYEKRWKIIRLQQKNSQEFTKIVKEQFPNLKPNEIKKIVNKRINLATDYSIKELLRDWLLFNKLEKHPELKNDPIRK